MHDVSLRAKRPYDPESGTGHGRRRARGHGKQRGRRARGHGRRRGSEHGVSPYVVASEWESAWGTAHERAWETAWERAWSFSSRSSLCCCRPSRRCRDGSPGPCSMHGLASHRSQCRRDRSSHRQCRPRKGACPASCNRGSLKCRMQKVSSRSFRLRCISIHPRRASGSRPEGSTCVLGTRSWSKAWETHGGRFPEAGSCSRPGRGRVLRICSRTFLAARILEQGLG